MVLPGSQTTKSAVRISLRGTFTTAGCSFKPCSMRWNARGPRALGGDTGKRQTLHVCLESRRGPKRLASSHILSVVCRDSSLLHESEAEAASDGSKPHGCSSSTSVAPDAVLCSIRWIDVNSSSVNCVTNPPVSLKFGHSVKLCLFASINTPGTGSRRR